MLIHYPVVHPCVSQLQKSSLTSVTLLLAVSHSLFGEKQWNRSSVDVYSTGTLALMGNQIKFSMYFFRGFFSALRQT